MTEENEIKIYGNIFPPRNILMNTQIELISIHETMMRLENRINKLECDEYLHRMNIIKSNDVNLSIHTPSVMQGRLLAIMRTQMGENTIHIKYLMDELNKIKEILQNVKERLENCENMDFDDANNQPIEKRKRRTRSTPRKRIKPEAVHDV